MDREPLRRNEERRLAALSSLRGHKRQADRKAENREAPHATFPAKQPFSAEEGTAKLVARCRVAREPGL